MTQVKPRLDRKKVERFAQRTSQQVAAAMNVRLSNLGDRLGLYKTIQKLGRVTSVSLADHTGFHERWVREWLRHQACNEQLDYHVADDAFSISAEVAAVLCDENSPFYFASGFGAAEATHYASTRLPDIFKSGIGLSYDDHGEDCACGVERMNNFIPRHVLVQEILPQVAGLVDRLKSGISVADVGCGAAIALLQMAQAFPKSTFVGYEISSFALRRARKNVDESGLGNVRILAANDCPLPSDHSIDFVCTFDVVHDAPFATVLIQEIFSSLKADGIWLCSDIRSFPKFEDNLNDNPHAALMYGFSLLVCMSSAMSEEGGEGLGTLGFNEEVAKKMTRSAGFSSFQKLPYENAVNSYYDIRP